MTEQLEEKKSLNLDNPDDVDWLYNWANKAQLELYELREKVSRLDAEVKVQAAEWTKEKPNKPCVFMTRFWNNHLKIYDYNIWRLITTNGESLEDATYLGWYTEGGDEWDDYSYCNFDEYKIIGEV